MNVLLMMIALLVSLVIGSNSWCQDKKLITKDDFIKEFRSPVHDKKNQRLNFRAITVLKRKPPEVTVQILFKFGSSKLADEFSQTQVQEAGKALSSDELSSFVFEIQGHTDNIGSEAYNIELSYDRAYAIKRILIDNFGIEENRLVTRGFGESAPVVSNETEAGQAKNRRVVIKRLN